MLLAHVGWGLAVVHRRGRRDEFLAFPRPAPQTKLLRGFGGGESRPRHGRLERGGLRRDAPARRLAAGPQQSHAVEGAFRAGGLRLTHDKPPCARRCSQPSICQRPVPWRDGNQEAQRSPDQCFRTPQDNRTLSRAPAVHSTLCLRCMPMQLVSPAADRSFSDADPRPRRYHARTRDAERQSCWSALPPPSQSFSHVVVRPRGGEPGGA